MLTAIVLIDTEVSGSQRSPRPSRTSTASTRSTPSPATSTSSPWSGSPGTRSSPVVTDAARQGHGVTGTRTYIAFRAYSRHDLEAAFAVGLDD